jgi:hypothetical protein
MDSVVVQDALTLKSLRRDFRHQLAAQRGLLVMKRMIAGMKSGSGMAVPASRTGWRSTGIEGPAIQDCLPDVTARQNHHTLPQFEGQNGNELLFCRSK